MDYDRRNILRSEFGKDPVTGAEKNIVTELGRDTSNARLRWNKFWIWLPRMATLGWLAWGIGSAAATGGVMGLVGQATFMGANLPYIGIMATGVFVGSWVARTLGINLGPSLSKYGPDFKRFKRMVHQNRFVRLQAKFEKRKNAYERNQTALALHINELGNLGSKADSLTKSTWDNKNEYQSLKKKIDKGIKKATKQLNRLVNDVSPKAAIKPPRITPLVVDHPVSLFRRIGKKIGKAAKIKEDAAAAKVGGVVGGASDKIIDSAFVVTSKVADTVVVTPMATTLRLARAILRPVARPTLAVAAGISGGNTKVEAVRNFFDNRKMHTSQKIFDEVYGNKINMNQEEANEGKVSRQKTKAKNAGLQDFLYENNLKDCQTYVRLRQLDLQTMCTDYKSKNTSTGGSLGYKDTSYNVKLNPSIERKAEKAAKRTVDFDFQQHLNNVADANNIAREEFRTAIYKNNPSDIVGHSREKDITDAKRKSDQDRKANEQKEAAKGNNNDFDYEFNKKADTKQSESTVEANRQEPKPANQEDKTQSQPKGQYIDYYGEFMGK